MRTDEWRGHGGAVLWRDGQRRVVRCDVCGFAHVVPLPEPTELADFYEERFYRDEKPEYLRHAAEDLEWLRLGYADRFDTFEALLPAGRRRLLDLGCGPGYFLLTGKERGWQVRGLEPAPAAVDHARRLGLDVFRGFAEEALASDLGSFDVVHMSEVLEHVHDPRRVVERAAGLLTPGGLIAVSVPNDFNPFQAALTAEGDHPAWWVVPEHHVNYFDGDSLAALLASCGLQEISREASFPMEMFALMGEDYIARPERGRELHGRRKRFELALARVGGNDVKRRLYRALASAGLGRTVWLVARKGEPR